ncbi:MAG TPA: energy-coupling factor transporter transmembrane component T [Geobacterales bacterium]|nr:energy-coupling factor transporter transmembrane component T [Geobacterales bacterium]
MRFEEVNPIVKFTIAVILFALLIFVKGISVLLTIFVLFSFFILVCSSKKSYGYFMLSITPFLIVLWIINAAFTFCGNLLFNFYTWKLTDVGVIAGSTVLLRITDMLLASYIFVSSTNPRDFMQAFVKYFKMDYRIAFAAFIAIRLIKEFNQVMREFSQAYKARGLNPRNPKRFLALINLILFSTLRKLLTIAISAESRGFGSYEYRLFRRDLKITSKDYEFIVISAIIISLSFILGYFEGDLYIGLYANSFC